MLDRRPRLAHELALALLVLGGAPVSTAAAQSGSTATFRGTPAALLKRALRSNAAAQARFRDRMR